MVDKEDQKAAAEVGAKKFQKSEPAPPVNDGELPDTDAEANDKEAEEKLADPDTDPADKPRLVGNILTTADARHEADLESEQIRQNAQRKAAFEAAEAAREAAGKVPDDYKDIRSPEPKE